MSARWARSDHEKYEKETLGYLICLLCIQTKYFVPKNFRLSTLPAGYDHKANNAKKPLQSSTNPYNGGND
jgi:hypothetical protein